MFRITTLTVLWMACQANVIYNPNNVTRSTVSGIAAYRSALTLDWLADEDSHQRDLAHVLENNAPMLSREIEKSDCMTSARPSTGKVARLMLEVLKNLEGDDSIIQNLIQTLIGAKLLVETSSLEAEPNLESLLKTQDIMQGEPHMTLPRVIILVWLLASDPINTKDSGWCSIRKLNRYMAEALSGQIAARIREIDLMAARARYILEEFVRSVALLNKRRPTSFPLKDYLKKNWNTTRAPTRTTFSEDYLNNQSQEQNATEPYIASITTPCNTNPVELKIVTVANAGYTHFRTFLLIISLFVI